VASATRERVERAAVDLDYLPNHAARELATARTATVTLLVHHAQYPAHGEGTFSSRVVDGISRALRADGYDLLYAPVDDRSVRHLVRLGSVRRGRTDGIIVLGPAFPRAALRDLRDGGRPMILIDNRLDGVDAVLADNRPAMRRMAEHLVDDHGYRRLACLAGPPGWPSTAERVAGVRDALVGRDVLLDVRHARETTIRDGATLATGLADDPPDAVVAVNDAMAIGALHRMRSSHREAIPITGFDDIAWSRLSDPPLTTVAVDALAIGAQAATMLLARMSESDHSRQRGREFRVPATLQLRRSCGCGSEPSDPTPGRAAAEAHTPIGST
jgi:LacI family transcriptional regulator